MTIDTLNDSSPLSACKTKLLNINGSEDFKYVLKHYNLCEDDVKEMVRSIKEWLKKQPHMPGDELLDQQLIGYLMFRGFHLEKVKANLDDFFRAPHKMPDLVCNRDPMDPIISEYLDRSYWACFPKKTPEDYRVTMFRMPASKSTDFALAIKIALMFSEIRIWNEASLGDCWILDVENFSLQDSLQFTPTLISNIVFYVLARFGAKIKSIHLLNVPSYGIALVNIFKSLIKKKIGDRIIFSTREDLLKTFPKECLANEYGGVGGNFDEISNEWRKTIQTEEWRQYFKKMDNLRTDESKRLVPLPENEIFGVEGSFRKISID